MPKDRKKSSLKNEIKQPLNWFIGTINFGHQGAGRSYLRTAAVSETNIFAAAKRIQRLGGAHHNDTPSIHMATKEELSQYVLAEPVVKDARWLD